MSRGPVVEGSHQLVNWENCPMSGLLRNAVPGGWIYKLPADNSSSWAYLLVPDPAAKVKA